MHYGIIAAGEGSRLRQEGVDKPKPLVSLNGVPMIERLARIFDDAGAESISVIVNEQMTEVRRFLEELAPKLRAPLNLVVRTTPSSMHSFYELSRHLKGKGRFILTTVDTIFRPEAFLAYVRAFEQQPESVSGMMAVTSFIDDEKPLYVATSPEMDILAFLDTPQPDIRFISGGIYGLSDPAIDILRDCIDNGTSRMRNYQRALVASGLTLKAFDTGKIIDVDHAADIQTAESFLNAPADTL